MSEELKPCPFCGCEAELVDQGTGSWRVACLQSKGGCGAAGRMTFDRGVTATSEWNRRAPLPAEQPSNPVLAHGHREDWYLMANARRIGMLSIACVKGMQNWVFAKQLFATGSTSARQICFDAGIDPDGYAVARIVGQQTKGGGNG